MEQPALGLLETKGLVALVTGTDAMLKAADVELTGPMTKVGSGLVTTVVTGDVAAVKAAADVGAQVASASGSVHSVHIIPKPEAGVSSILPKKTTKKSGK